MTAFRRRPFMALPVCALFLQFTPVALADVDADVALARSAARSGQFDQACRIGIAALEAYPESSWDTAVLRRFIVEVSQRWLHQMSPEEQAGLLADMDNPGSAGARWTKAYLLWKRNQREACLSALLALIQSHPEAVGTEFAIRGSLVVRWPLMGHEETLGAVRAVADWAPENPGTGWALCRFTWRAGSAKRPELARRLFAKVLEDHPDTLAGNVANRLGSGLDAIEAGDYPGALEALKGLAPYLMLATPPDGIINTLCLGIDFSQRDLAASQAAPLRAAFGLMAQTDSNPVHRQFGYAVLGGIAEKLGDREGAMGHYQQLVDVDEGTLGPYGMRWIARLCHRTDPERAIGLLERFRDEESPAGVTSMETTYLFLGRLYVRQKKHETGEAYFRWLQDRREAGEFIRDSVREEEEILAGLAGCLFGQSKDEEAHAVIDPVLAKYGYGAAIETLDGRQRTDLAQVLTRMGRDAEAQQYLREPGS